MTGVSRLRVFRSLIPAVLLIVALASEAKADALSPSTSVGARPEPAATGNANVSSPLVPISGPRAWMLVAVGVAVVLSLGRLWREE